MKLRTRRTLLAVLNAIGLAGTIAVNALANILPINGKNTGAISDSYPNLFVPAALTFSIWGLIYLMLVAFVVYGFVVLFGKKNDETSALEKTGVFFFISCALNSGWIFAWHYELIGVSFAIMLALLATLITMYLRLGIGKSNASAGERYTVHAATSVYLGWISIATIANASALLVSLGWDGFGIPDQAWTATVMGAGILLGLLSLFTRKDLFYPLVVVWALIGILIKRMANAPAEVPAIIVVVIAGIALVSISMLVQAVRRKIY